MIENKKIIESVYCKMSQNSRPNIHISHRNTEHMHKGFCGLSIGPLRFVAIYKHTPLINPLIFPAGIPLITLVNQAPGVCLVHLICVCLLKGCTSF